MGRSENCAYPQMDPNGTFHRENDDSRKDLEVPYFQTNPYTNIDTDYIHINSHISHHMNHVRNKYLS